ncbi:MAG: class I SAM-dependent methyltransferase [Rhizomicrobium sp.]
MGAAMHRAAHQLLNRPLVFEDPLALPIIGAEAQLRGGDWHGFATPALRAFIVARARHTEDILAGAVARGIQQYVLLGAGLDTYAYRRGGDRPRVFEVDHPATQAWKRARLDDAGIAVPANLVFVPVDFEHESLSTGLKSAGFDFKSPAVVAWLGVTAYLARETAMATLGVLAAGLQAGSDIVFDYGEPVEARDPALRARFEALSARVAKAGEPFRSFFNPEEMACDLRTLGFSQICDLDAPALDARYFAGRDDGLRTAGVGHCLHARV